MKASELRIGNWIQSRGVTGEFNNWQVTSEDIPQIFDNEHLEDQYRGIPLTEKWFEKLGFRDVGLIEGGSLIGRYAKYPTTIYPCANNTWGARQIEHRIKYVHQLQNLYFALTQEELTIKK